MPATDEQREHNARLRKEYTRRMRLLQIREARQGPTVDPAILTEIEDIRTKLLDIDLADAPPPAPEVKESIRRWFDDDLDFLIATFRGILERQTRTEERQERMEERQERTEERLVHVESTQAAAQVWRTTEHDRNVHWQRLLLSLLIAAVVLGVVSLAVVMYVFR